METWWCFSLIGDSKSEEMTTSFRNFSKSAIGIWNVRHANCCLQNKPSDTLHSSAKWTFGPLKTVSTRTWPSQGVWSIQFLSIDSTVNCVPFSNWCTNAKRPTIGIFLNCSTNWCTRVVILILKTSLESWPCANSLWQALLAHGCQCIFFTLCFAAVANQHLAFAHPFHKLKKIQPHQCVGLIQ